MRAQSEMGLAASPGHHEPVADRGLATRKRNRRNAWAVGALLILAAPAQADTIEWQFEGDDPATPGIEDGYWIEEYFDPFTVSRHKICAGGDQQFGLVWFPGTESFPGGRAYYHQYYADGSGRHFYVRAADADRGFHSSFGDCHPDGSVSE